MKKLVKITLLTGIIALALTGCDDKAELKTDTQKEAYAAGASFANYTKAMLDAQHITLDKEMVVKGFAETFQGNGQMTEEEIDATLKAFDQKLQAQQQAQIEKNAADGAKFREEYAKKEGVKKTASGLLYRIIKQGDSKHPTANDTVVAKYSGKLIDGREFDASKEDGISFSLKETIKGWSEGLQLIGKGGQIELVIPPELGFGANAIPGVDGNKIGIPAQSTLVFNIELVDIK